MNELGLWFQPQLVKSLEFIALILITTKNKLEKMSGKKLKVINLDEGEVNQNERD